jgi:hypothetical protein
LSERNAPVDTDVTASPLFQFRDNVDEVTVDDCGVGLGHLRLCRGDDTFLHTVYEAGE